MGHCDVVMVGAGPSGLVAACYLAGAGRCVSGADRYPTGGLAGTPGRRAARALLADRS